MPMNPPLRPTVVVRFAIIPAPDPIGAGVSYEEWRLREVSARVNRSPRSHWLAQRPPLRISLSTDAEPHAAKVPLRAIHVLRGVSVDQNDVARAQDLKACGIRLRVKECS